MFYFYHKTKTRPRSLSWSRQRLFPTVKGKNCVLLLQRRPFRTLILPAPALTPAKQHQPTTHREGKQTCAPRKEAFKIQ